MGSRDLRRKQGLVKLQKTVGKEHWGNVCLNFSGLVFRWWGSILFVFVFLIYVG